MKLDEGVLQLEEFYTTLEERVDDKVFVRGNGSVCPARKSTN